MERSIVILLIVIIPIAIITGICFLIHNDYNERPKRK